MASGATQSNYQTFGYSYNRTLFDTKQCQQLCFKEGGEGRREGKEKGNYLEIK